MTALVWFRRVLRVHDHPALASALRATTNRRESLRERGGDLVVRHGRPEDVLAALAREVGASSLCFASDASPFRAARRRLEEWLAGGIGYVRRWVPELRGVPLERLVEPWRMTGEQQAAAACVIGRDHPAPVVAHQVERRVAFERYRAVAGG